VKEELRAMSRELLATRSG